MADNVIRLPRPRSARSPADALGLFVRVGRNDHKELLHIVAAGEKSIFGFVIDAHYATRHRDLIAEAKKREFDLILDPRTQPLALPGGYKSNLAELPWAGEGPHTLRDFDGEEGRQKAVAIVDYAIAHGFTQMLGPTHVLRGANDQWLRRDIEMMGRMSAAIRARKTDLDLIYSLAVPMEVLRNPAERGALIHALADAPMDALWLKVENFGDDASGEKTAAFIDAMRDFHQLKVPIVADHVGGLPALAALAFGAVGGIAHGVTMNQGFSASRWRRPPKEDGEEDADVTADEEGKKKKKGMATWRVYLSTLDVLLKKADAEKFLSVSTRVRGKHSCKDTNCCPHGQKDMIERPARHAIYQRAREVDWLSKTPQGLRAAQFVDERVRRVSDDVAAAAALAGLAEPVQKALAKKQVAMSRFRQVMAHLVTETRADSVAISPPRRSVRRAS